jgi:hypothetical protein
MKFAGHKENALADKERHNTGREREIEGERRSVTSTNGQPRQLHPPFSSDAFELGHERSRKIRKALAIRTQHTQQVKRVNHIVFTYIPHELGQ